MSERLTKAQTATLKAASKPGGVVGFGQRYKVAGPLRKRGLLEPNKQNFGYLVLTPAGRTALSQEGGE